MKPITKADFARIIPMSPSRLRVYTQSYKEELGRLKQQGNSFNYKSVLFLCWKIVIDPIEMYPTETKENLIIEQEKVLAELYGSNKENWN